jgi:hypothetical protein
MGTKKYISDLMEFVTLDMVIPVTIIFVVLASSLILYTKANKKTSVSIEE